MQFSINLLRYIPPFQMLLFTLLVSGCSAAVITQRSGTLPSGWKYAGCYSDDAGNRVLSAAGYASQDSMTQESCASYCQAGGYNFAGVEYGSECWCGYNLASSAASKPETDCSMACSGDSTENCGDGGRISVFTNGGSTTTNPGVNGWTSLGCYNDTIGSRTLSNSQSISGGASSMTVAKCVAACDAAGYGLAGVEYGNECFCDTAIRNYGSLASSGCSMACAANTSEFCGGPGRINVYVSGVPLNLAEAPAIPADWTSMGCFADTANARTLRNRQEVPGGSDNMTIEGCLNACSASGFAFAGLEYGQECYCDSSVYQNNGGCASDQSTCYQPCRGRTSETCGGPDRMNVYALGSAAVPSSSCIKPSKAPYKGPGQMSATAGSYNDVMAISANVTGAGDYGYLCGNIDLTRTLDPVYTRKWNINPSDGSLVSTDGNQLILIDAGPNIAWLVSVTSYTSWVAAEKAYYDRNHVSYDPNRIAALPTCSVDSTTYQLSCSATYHGQAFSRFGFFPEFFGIKGLGGFVMLPTDVNAKPYQAVTEATITMVPSS